METVPKRFAMVHLAEDEYLDKKKFRKENYGNYSMTRRLKTMWDKNNTQDDVVDLMTKLSKGAATLFRDLKLRMNPYNNLVHYPKTNFTKSYTTMFSRYFVELKKHNMVKKAVTVNQIEPIEKDSYMINPELFIPVNREVAMATWKLLK